MVGAEFTAVITFEEMNGSYQGLQKCFVAVVLHVYVCVCGIVVCLHTYVYVCVWIYVHMCLGACVRAHMYLEDSVDAGYFS